MANVTTATSASATAAASEPETARDAVAAASSPKASRNRPVNGGGRLMQSSDYL